MFNCIHPYPCGYYGDSLKLCTCAPAMVTKHQKRISGPLLDRIDIHIEVPRVDYEKLSGNKVSESSESIRKRVQVARDIQNKRFANEKTTDIVCNADMRILKLSRTIADLAGSDEIQSTHLAEALQYRPKLML